MAKVLKHPSSNIHQQLSILLEREVDKMLEDTNYPYRKVKNEGKVLEFNKEGTKQCANKS